MKRILLLFIALAAVWGAAAKIRLPEIIGNDMVLQQNAEVRLWGWAEPYAAVKVETSWGAGAAVKSDAEGRWVVSVRTPAGSYEPQRITFASGDRVTFDRVLIGEVWFAGGQSNMEMPLGGFWQCPVTDANEIIARAGAKSGKLHYVKIPHAAAYTPQDRTAGSWTPCTTATAAKFTAAGYFFAEMLNDVLGVPVGIIDCSWGGSRVESWMSREVLSGYSDIDLTEEGISRVAQHLRPMAAALVEDRGVFAACGPVVASDADVIVAGQRREHALQLAVEDLLRPEDVEVVEPDQRRDHRETPLPAVALGRVLGVELADVVGRGRETLRRGVEGRHACDGHADQ